MTRQLPAGHVALFKHLDRPQITIAIVQNAKGNTVSLGAAKFNPKDGERRPELGERIALGRALATLEHGTGLNPGVNLYDAVQLSRPRSVA